jgi:hypothetical protein
MLHLIRIRGGYVAADKNTGGYVAEDIISKSKPLVTSIDEQW